MLTPVVCPLSQVIDAVIEHRHLKCKEESRA
jgi:hypothetical protein